MVKKREKQGWKFDIRQLDNKSRSGTYYYVKFDNKPGRYYKFDGSDAQIDIIKQYYADRYIKKKSKGSYKLYSKTYTEKIKGVKLHKRSSISRQADQYVSKLKKQKPILDTIKRGIKSVRINNMLNVNIDELQRVKKELLYDLVLDKQLLNILIKDNNFNKLANRLDYVIQAKDSNGNVLIDASIHGQPLIAVKSHVQNAFRGNKQVNKHKYHFLKYLKNVGYEGELKGDGIIDNVCVTITFRRG